jgi:DNA gyrase subunit A
MSDVPPENPEDNDAQEGDAQEGGSEHGDIVLSGEDDLVVSGVEPITISEEMERSFLDYAMSVIVSRALPDARDGLKPVHRRILWGMYDLGVRPDRSYVKCARVVGDVMGLYHPHGDQAIYDALVRLGQPFSVRHMLIDGHGNFGSPNDMPAAMRYTECRLDSLAMQMLAGIDEDTVDFVPNYSNETEEPSVLPARFPNLLVNGQQGIAVGMATNIPPHNLGEIIDAACHVLDNPEATPDELMEFVSGPDFPTGGLIMGRQGILDAYRTGRGSIRMRAVAEIIEGDRSDTIVVTEIPYQTSVESIETKIAEVVDAKRLDGIRAIRNESAKGKTRLVIELKRDAPALVILNSLYKMTPLQTTFAVNMVALVDGIPRTLNLAEVLRAYCEHQVEVITRRTEYRLRKAQDEEHIVEGLIRAQDMIDEIIATIRGSEDRNAARTALMADPFLFSEVQANHILDMTLARLTRLGRARLEERLLELRDIITELQRILGDPTALRDVIKTEMKEISEKFATPRRSVLSHDPGEIDIEDLIDDEDLVVTLTSGGYIKSTSPVEFRVQSRGGRGIRGASLKDGNYVTHMITTTAHAYLLLFSTRGKVYRVKAHEIPMRDRSARGTAVVNLLPLQPGESIQAIVDTRDYETSRYLFFTTKLGQVKKTKFTDYDSSRKDGLIAIGLRDDDELVEVMPTSGEDDIFLVARSGQTIRFNESEVRAMGRTAGGVRGMRLRKGDTVVSAAKGSENVMLLTITDQGYGKRTELEQYPRKGRGTMGVRGIRITDDKGHVVVAMMVTPDEQLLLMNSAGVLIRTKVEAISTQGRAATGVRVMAVGDDDRVVAVARILGADELDDELLDDELLDGELLDGETQEQAVEGESTPPEEQTSQ